MNIERTSFNNIKEFLEYMYDATTNGYDNPFEFHAEIHGEQMDFHIYRLGYNFTFNKNNVNQVLSLCTSNDTYTQVILGFCINVENGTILTPPKRCKGLIIYDRGVLSNFGTISMYARGCVAEGQNIYLTDTEFVPAVGGAGGAALRTAGTQNGVSGVPNYSNGQKGKDGTNRGTGGGGSGSIRNYVAVMTSGAGAAGTSYSGGSGGGAAAADRGTGGAALSGSPNGGKGGNARHSGMTDANTQNGVNSGSTNGWGQGATGGQGNPAGANVCSHAEWYTPIQDEGTGGLLIIFCKNLYNKGKITADGVPAKYITITKWTGSQGTGGAQYTGGSSGGGSVNIFCDTMYRGAKLGAITANGGKSQNSGTNVSTVGGAGGNGSISIDYKSFYTADIYDQNKEYEYITRDFLYKGRNEQYFTFYAGNTYTIEIWGARGSSDDGDNYDRKVNGSYGSYVYTTYKPLVTTKATLVVGESGGCGGNSGWPEENYTENSWANETEQRSHYFTNTSGGSSYIEINGKKLVQAIGGASGTSHGHESSFFSTQTVDASRCTQVNSIAECDVYKNSNEYIYTDFISMNFTSIMIFTIPASRTMEFTWESSNNEGFLEFRAIEFTSAYDSNMQYDTFRYKSGTSGTFKFTVGNGTIYAIQAKSSVPVSFTCSISDVSDATHFHYTSESICTHTSSGSVNQYHDSYRVDEIVRPASVNIIPADSITDTVAIPSKAGYHGMIRISYYDDIDNLYEPFNTHEENYTGSTKRITLVPDRLGPHWLKTEFILECWGAAGYSNDSDSVHFGNYVKGSLFITEPTPLYLNVGGKGTFDNAGWNGGKQSYMLFNNTYGYGCSGGNTDISLYGEDNSTEWNTEEHLNNIILMAIGGNPKIVSTTEINAYIINNMANDYKANFNYTSITTTSVYGRATSVKGRDTAPVCLVIKPKVTGTLHFWSTNQTNDSYGYVTGATTVGNDDGGDSTNFSISITVNAGSIYYLRDGSYSSGAISNNFNATFPESQIYVLVNGNLAEVKLNTHTIYLDKHYTDIVHDVFVNTETQQHINNGNGKIKITKIGEKKHDDYIFDPLSERLYNNDDVINSDNVRTIIASNINGEEYDESYSLILSDFNIDSETIQSESLPVSPIENDSVVLLDTNTKGLYGTIIQPGNYIDIEINGSNGYANSESNRSKASLLKGRIIVEHSDSPLTLYSLIGYGGGDGGPSGFTSTYTPYYYANCGAGYKGGDGAFLYDESFNVLMAASGGGGMSGGGDNANSANFVGPKGGDADHDGLTERPSSDESVPSVNGGGGKSDGTGGLAAYWQADDTNKYHAASCGGGGGAGWPAGGGGGGASGNSTSSYVRTDSRLGGRERPWQCLEQSYTRGQDSTIEYVYLDDPLNPGNSLPVPYGKGGTGGENDTYCPLAAYHKGTGTGGGGAGGSHYFDSSIQNQECSINSFDTCHVKITATEFTEMLRISYNKPKYSQLDIQDIYNYQYTGETQEITLNRGIYLFECWGANDGSNTVKGGYSAGICLLETETDIFINVGGHGEHTDDETIAFPHIAQGGFNGGGNAYMYHSSGSNSRKCYAGGGASDVRIGSNDIDARIIVAGGAGGVYNQSDPTKTYKGYGGGDNSIYYSFGHSEKGIINTELCATQESSGINANNSNGATIYESNVYYYDTPGGGGGWYGGGANRNDIKQSAAGGSGYVYTKDTAQYYNNRQLFNKSMYLANTINASGISNIPQCPDNIGHGFVRISKIETTARFTFDD